MLWIALAVAGLAIAGAAVLAATLGRSRQASGVRSHAARRQQAETSAAATMNELAALRATPPAGLVDSGVGEAIERATRPMVDPNGNRIVPSLPISPPIRQLPPPSRNFTGRTAELAELLPHVASGPIVISGVNGHAGIGKSATALVVCDRVKTQYPDAQFFLDLRGSEKNPLSAGEILSHVILSCHPEARLPEDIPSLQAIYRSLLAERRALLLLDNAADAAQVATLVPPPSCALIVTSRRQFTLPGGFSLTLDRLPESDAVALLLRLVPRIGTEAPEVARLCGYVPLALRICAGLLAVHADMSPGAFVRLLAVDRDAQMSEVESCLSLSDVTLPIELRKLWHMLCVFPGTFSPLAAAAVWELPQEGADEALGQLLRHCLIEYNSSSQRYRLQSVVRRFIETRISDEDRATAQRLHAAYFRAVANAADGLYLKGGASLRRGLVLFDQDWHNIRAGFDWSRSNAALNEAAARLCAAYPAAAMYCLSLRHQPREWITWLDAAMAAARRVKDRSAEEIHNGSLGRVYANMGEARRAIDYHQQAVNIARDINDRHGEAAALVSLGNAYVASGEVRQGIEHLDQSLRIARELSDRRAEAHALGALGAAYAELGEMRRAIGCYEQILVIAREIPDRPAEAKALGQMASAYAALNELPRAMQAWEQQLAVARAIGDQRTEAMASWNLGLQYAKQGEIARAISAIELCVEYDRQHHSAEAADHATALAQLRATVKR